MKKDSSSARASRRSASFHSLITLGLFALIVVGINIVAFKHYVHHDFSRSQFYTLSPKTIDILKHLPSPVTATEIFSSTTARDPEAIENLLKEYARAGGKDFSFEKIDAALDIARAAALQKRLQFDGSENLVIFEYKGHARFIKQEDLYDVNPMTGQVGAFKGEQQFTAAIIALTEGQASKIYFTEGHGEHALQDNDSANGYGIVGQTLKNENVETENLNLAAKGDVPADASAVVIAGPSIAFSPLEAEAIDRYLSNNGKLLILADPFTNLGLDDVLKRYGLQFDNDLVLYRVMASTGQQTTVSIALIYQGGFSSQPITARFASASLELQINGARSITLLKDAKGQTNPKDQFLLQTDPDAWGWVNKPNAPLPDDPQAITFNKATDIPGPVTIGAVYDGGTITDTKTQAIVPATRLVLFGSSKFLQNSLVQNVGANLFANSVDWLVKTQPILDINPKIPQEYGLSISPLQSRTIQWTALIVIPGIALILALFTWLSRRK